MTRARHIAIIAALGFFVGSGALWLGWHLRGVEVELREAQIRELELQVVLSRDEAELWQRRAQGAQDAIVASRVRIVEVTAYTASRAECDADPHIAASNEPPRPGTVAVSRDLFDLGWTFGKRVYLKGLGPYTINDVMNERYQSRVDVFIGHRKQAIEFGVRTLEARLG